MTNDKLAEKLLSFPKGTEVIISDGYKLNFYSLDNAKFGMFENQLDIGVGGCDLMPKFTKESLTDLFKTNKTLKVTFFKKDGSLREMICTTDFPEYEKKDPDKPSRPTPDHLFPVFDLEANALRAFTIDKVISVEEI